MVVWVVMKHAGLKLAVVVVLIIAVIAAGRIFVIGVPGGVDGVGVELQQRVTIIITQTEIAMIDANSFEVRQVFRVE